MTSVPSHQEGPSDEAEATTPTSEEVAQTIAELEQYRQRIIDETIEAAKKLKLPKQATMTQLDNHPEIARIDSILSNVRQRIATEDNALS